MVWGPAGIVVFAIGLTLMALGFDEASQRRRGWPFLLAGNLLTDVGTCLVGWRVLAYFGLIH